jgi:N-hydroxyarylamine O-acetyltransferase
MTFDLNRYFNRISLKNTFTTNETSLFDFQTQQLKSITFENLDCLIDRDILLDSDSLQKKIVVEHRGGYCFELNQLLLEALSTAGFKARPILSRVMYRGTGINPKTHIFLIVTLNNKKYIVDAGFGGPGLFTPMPFELNRIDSQVNGNFKVEADQEFGFILKKETQEKGVWQNVFAFHEDQVYPADLEMSNFYTSKVPQSHFRHNIIAALFTEHGRYTLLNRKFSTLAHNGKIETKDIESEIELLNILTTKFNLKVPSELSLSKFF